MTESVLSAPRSLPSTATATIENRHSRPRRLPIVLLAAFVGLASDVASGNDPSVPVSRIRPLAVAFPSPTWVEGAILSGPTHEEMEARVRAICHEAQYTQPLNDETNRPAYTKIVYLDGKKLEILSFIKDQGRNAEITHFLNEHIEQMAKLGAPAGTDISQWRDFKAIVVDDDQEADYPVWDQEGTQSIEDPFAVSAIISPDNFTVILRFNNDYSPGEANRWVGHHFRETPSKPAA